MRVRTDARSRLGDFSDLRKRKSSPQAGVSGMLPRSLKAGEFTVEELNRLGRQLLAEQETIFYLPEQYIKRKDFLLSRMPKMEGVPLVRFLPRGEYFGSQAKVTFLAIPTLLDNSRFFGEKPERVPRRALTLTGAVHKAREIVLVANGEAKQAAVSGAFSGSITSELPASILQSHPHITFIVDEEAAGGISRETRMIAQGIPFIREQFEINSQTGEIRFIQDHPPLVSLDADVYFVRHGKTLANEQKIFQGRGDGERAQLSEKGFRETQEGARILLGHIAPDLQKGARVILLSSPRVRARETAQIYAWFIEGEMHRHNGWDLGKRPHDSVPIEEEEFLQEINLGLWQGRKYQGDLPENEQVLLDRFLGGRDFLMHPGGGSSLYEAMASAILPLRRLALCIQAMKEKVPARKVIVIAVGHGMSSAATRALLGDKTLTAADRSGSFNWANPRIPNGTPAYLDCKIMSLVPLKRKEEAKKRKESGWFAPDFAEVREPEVVEPIRIPAQATSLGKANRANPEETSLDAQLVLQAITKDIPSKTQHRVPFSNLDEEDRPRESFLSLLISKAAHRHENLLQLKFAV